MWRKQLTPGEPAVSLTQKEEARRAGGPLALPQEDTRMGCATGVAELQHVQFAVSIHASLGGATWIRAAMERWTEFQSTRPWGARRAV